MSMQQVMSLVDEAGIVQSTTAISQILGQTLNPKGENQDSKKSET